MLGHAFHEAGQLHPTIRLGNHLAQALLNHVGLRGRLLGHLEHRLVHHAVLHLVLIKLRYTGIAAVAFLLRHLINADGHLDVAGGVIRVDNLAPLLLRCTLRRALRRTLAGMAQTDTVPHVAAGALLLQVTACIYILFIKYRIVIQSIIVVLGFSMNQMATPA